MAYYKVGTQAFRRSGALDRTFDRCTTLERKQSGIYVWDSYGGVGLLVAYSYNPGNPTPYALTRPTEARFRRDFSLLSDRIADYFSEQELDYSGSVGGVPVHPLDTRWQHNPWTYQGERLNKQDNPPTVFNGATSIDMDCRDYYDTATPPSVPGLYVATPNESGCVDITQNWNQGQAMSFPWTWHQDRLENFNRLCPKGFDYPARYTAVDPVEQSRKIWSFAAIRRYRLGSAPYDSTLEVASRTKYFVTPPTTLRIWKVTSTMTADGVWSTPAAVQIEQRPYPRLVHLPIPDLPDSWDLTATWGFAVRHYATWE